MHLMQTRLQRDSAEVMLTKSDSVEDRRAGLQIMWRHWALLKPNASLKSRRNVMDPISPWTASVCWYKGSSLDYSLKLSLPM